jgi:arginase family enzyme
VIGDHHDRTARRATLLVRAVDILGTHRLTSRELLRVLRGLTTVNLISGDIVAVAPPYDQAEVTSIAAATVIFDLLALLAG